MRGPILRLEADELCSAVSELDPLQVITEQLLARGHEPGRPATTSPTEWRDLPGALTLFRDEDTGTRCALPAAGLRACRIAALTALAARQLLAPGVVTASVIGSGPLTQLLLLVVARHVPDVSHITLCPLEGTDAHSIHPEVADQLELAGIGLSVTFHAENAVFGANLVAVADFAASGLRTGHICAGALLVNASGRSLPKEVLHGVNQVYVDDLALLREPENHCFVQAHQTEAGAHPPERHPRIDSDLHQVLIGERPGRTDLDHVLLVDLLSTAVLDQTLAGRIHRAALRRGLGVLVHG